MDLLTTMQAHFRGEKLKSALILALMQFPVAAAIALSLLVKHPFDRGLAGISC
jgi:hypothetical protein